MPDAIEDFLADFFGQGNAIQVAVASTQSDGAAWLEPWIDDLRRPDRPPVLLPRRREIGAPLEIYALAFSDEQMRMLGDELNAFVGPTDTDFDRRPARLDLGESVDAAVAGFTGDRAFHFTILADTADAAQRRYARAVLDRIQLMREVWRRRPFVEIDAEVSTARLLGRFELALRRGDVEAADAIVGRLTAEARLGARNVLFLRVQSMAAREAWAEILAMDQLAAILHIPRPAAVNDALIRSVYNAELAGFEPDDPHGAIEHFRQAILPRYSSLFGVSGRLVNREVAVSLLLVAATREPADPQLRDRVLAEFPNATTDAYIRQLSDVIPAVRAPTPAPTASRVALAYFQEERYDDALAAAAAWEPASDDDRVERLQLIVDSAWHSDTLPAADLALDVVSGAPPDLVERLRSGPKHAQRLDDLGERRSAPVGVPSGWNTWIDKLDDGGDGARLLDAARRGATEWEAEAFTAEAAGEFNNRLGRTREHHVQAIVLAVVPSLLSFLDRIELPAPALRPLHQTLLSLLSFDPEQGSEERAALLDVLEWLLANGLTAEDYREAVEHMDYVWGRTASRATVDFALDSLDLLAAYPTADEGARRAFATRILAFMATPGRQVESYQWNVLGLQAPDLGMTDEFEAVRPSGELALRLTDDERSRLSNKLVGAYSLESSALSRFKVLIEDAYDDVDVRLNSDHVATTALVQLAREADVMLLATRSAKHAATDAVKRERAESALPTLIAAGKGTASLWRRLQEYLSEVE